jgi:hypothetical protein
VFTWQLCLPGPSRGCISSPLFLRCYWKHLTVVACFLVTTTTTAPFTSLTRTTIHEDNNQNFNGNAKHIDANQYHGQHGTFIRTRGRIIHDQCKPTNGRQGQGHASHKSTPIFTVRFKRSRFQYWKEKKRQEHQKFRTKETTYKQNKFFKNLPKSMYINITKIAINNCTELPCATTHIAPVMIIFCKITTISNH